MLVLLPASLSERRPSIMGAVSMYRHALLLPLQLPRYHKRRIVEFQILN